MGFFTDLDKIGYPYIDPDKIGYPHTISNCTIHQPIDNVLFYSVFQTFQRKNDRSVILKSLNPEGPLDSYLCDLTVPTLLITCQFLFCGQESKQRIFFLRVKKIYILSFFG